MSTSRRDLPSSFLVEQVQSPGMHRILAGVWVLGTLAVLASMLITRTFAAAAAFVVVGAICAGIAYRWQRVPLAAHTGAGFAYLALAYIVNHGRDPSQLLFLAGFIWLLATGLQASWRVIVALSLTAVAAVWVLPALVGTFRLTYALISTLAVIAIGAAAWTLSHLLSEIDRQMRHFKALSSSAALLGRLDDQALLSDLSYHVVAATGADSCVVLLWDERERVLVPRAVNLSPDHYDPVEEQLWWQLRVPPGEGLSGWAFAHRQCVLTGDSERDPRAVHIEGTEYEDASAILAPLLHNDGCLGVIRASRRGINQFRPIDLELLETIAIHAAIGLENSRLYQETVRMARTDALTGLRNRHYLNELWAKRLAADAKDDDLSLIFIDVNQFKQYNDTLGHLAGDARLQQVAKLLAAHVRGEDIVVRYGGDEFLIVLPGANAAEAQRVMRRLAQAVEAVNRSLAPGDVPLDLAIGMESAHGSEIRTLLDRADKAMYEAKQARRQEAMD